MLPYGDNVNVELWQEIKKQILADPESFDMRRWYIPRTRSLCGTTCCFAGWANAIWYQRYNMDAELLEGVCANAPLAASLLGMPPPTRAGYPGSDVFYAQFWPAPYRGCYWGCLSRGDYAGAAQVAAEFIDFICYGPDGKPPEKPPIEVVIEAPIQKAATRIAV